MLSGLFLFFGGAFGLYVRDHAKDPAAGHGIELNTWLNAAMLVLTAVALFVALRSYVIAKQSFEGAVDAGLKQEKSLDASRARARLDGRADEGTASSARRHSEGPALAACFVATRTFDPDGGGSSRWPFGSRR